MLKPPSAIFRNVRPVASPDPTSQTDLLPPTDASKHTLQEKTRGIRELQPRSDAVAQPLVEPVSDF